MTWLPATPAAAATAPVILFRAPALATFQSSNSNPVKSDRMVDRDFFKSRR